MNSEDFKCNTCGDYVGEEGVWGLCDPCFDKEGGNEALAKSFGHGKEAGLSVDDPAKLAALTEAAQARHFNEVCEQSDMDQLNGPLG